MYLRSVSAPVLLLALCVFGVVGLGPVRRQDAASTTTTIGNAPSTTGAEQRTSSAAESVTTSPTASISVQITTNSSSTTVSATSTTSTSGTPTAFPTAINGNSPDDAGRLNNGIVAPGELPLEPRVTPGWIVVGVIMIITGAVFALGIKSVWLRTFFSTAYLAGLSVSVLIVYIVVLPVPDAIHGAYVVAAVCTGLILGGAALVFKELTESLGCLLGGFCLSMWLLTLQDGGLLRGTSKIIFIAIFTVAGFVLYFSRYTRDYALIVFSAFAGATAIVMGIDCVSRAGLKEFWAYIWALNDNLFPMNTNTYPLTKGIRVEVALTIIFCVVGIISQLKLWRKIQERRATRAEARAEAQRNLDAEEENIGKQLETQNAVERRKWEARYGEPQAGTVARSGDSAVSDVSDKDEKKEPVITETTANIPAGEEEIELSDMSASSSPQIPTKNGAEGLMTANTDDESRVTVRVATDDTVPHGPNREGEPEQNIWIVGTDGEARPASQVTARTSKRFSRSQAPEIVPLPFSPSATDSKQDDDRSSIATFADDDNGSIKLPKRASRASLGQRLSVGSENLLRSLSRNSRRSGTSNKNGDDLNSPQLSPTFAESQEALVLRNVHPDEDEDTRSMAATLDDMSEGAAEALGSEWLGPSGFSNDILAAFGDVDTKTGLVKGETASSAEEPAGKGLGLRPYSAAETVGTDILDASVFGESAGSKSKRSSTNPAAKTETATENDQTVDTALSESGPETAKVAASVAASEASATASLTKNRLPRSLSRVALSYRTNEWAKHLSHADLPEPEKLNLSEGPTPDEATTVVEAATPVDVGSLGQTATTGSPAPVGRSVSSRSSAISSSGNAPHALHTSHSYRTKTGAMNRRASTVAEPIAEEIDLGQHPVPANPQHPETDSDGQAALVDSPTTSESPQIALPPIPGIVSHSSPQTLLAQREMLLRTKSQISLGEHGGFPSSASDAGSVYNMPMRASFIGQDPDDLPLSHRKQLIRQNSLLSSQPQSLDIFTMASGVGQTLVSIGADRAAFNSHQPPTRSSTLPTPAAREAQLASFRQSVAQDLRSGTPIVQANGREGARVTSSSIPYGYGVANREAEAQRSIDQGWGRILNQKDQEAQRREQQLWEKERNDRAFEESMRRGDLLDAHREAMRKMQSAAHRQ